MNKRDNKHIFKKNLEIKRHLDKPRILPLDETDFIKELYLFHNAVNRLEYAYREEIESDWESEMNILVQWLKNYNKTTLKDLSSFLKLREQGLDIDLIKFEDFKDSIKSYIRQEGNIFNIRATMIKYRKLRLKWLLMASHVTYDSSIPPRDKEVLILRIAWLCGAKYEWDHHVIVGKRVGLSNDEINRIKEGSEAQGWNHFDAALLRAVDELYKNTFISEVTWKSLTKYYDSFQLMDLTFVVGAYNMLAMFLNSFGIQTEDCVKNLLD
ncbi:MAG: carboxymuconolactone decarboxylase family protein [Candidatus Thorarchaeota archaeon]